MIEKIKSLLAIKPVCVVLYVLLGLLALAAVDAIWWDGGYGAWVGQQVERLTGGAIELPDSL